MVTLVLLILITSFFLNKKFPNANWDFYVRGEKQERDVQKLIDKERIMNSYIYPVETMK